jgi:hypothetical protein
VVSAAPGGSAATLHACSRTRPPLLPLPLSDSPDGGFVLSSIVSLVGFRVHGFVGALGVDHSINEPLSLTPPLSSQANPSDPAIIEIYRDEHFPGIFIGGIGAARNFAGLNALGIKSVLDVAAGDPRQQAGSLHYYA